MPTVCLYCANTLAQSQEMRKKTPSISFDPKTLELIDAYAEQRGVSRSTALSELALYVLKGDECETNPKVIEQAISAIRELEGASGRA